jgi:hypothetical protein
MTGTLRLNRNYFADPSVGGAQKARSMARDSAGLVKLTSGHHRE